MDELDGMLLGLCICALSVAVLLVANRVRSLETDRELARMAGPVKTGGVEP